MPRPFYGNENKKQIQSASLERERERGTQKSVREGTVGPEVAIVLAAIVVSKTHSWASKNTF